MLTTFLQVRLIGTIHSLWIGQGIVNSAEKDEKLQKIRSQAYRSQNPNKNLKTCLCLPTGEDSML